MPGSSYSFLFHMRDTKPISASVQLALSELLAELQAKSGCEKIGLPPESFANSPSQDKPPAPAAANLSFDPLADQALLAMKQRAQELNIKGVALVAYAPGDTVQSWSSKMVVVGNLRTR